MKAREIVAERNDEIGCLSFARQVREGELDDEDEVQSALAAIRWCEKALKNGEMP